MYPTRKHFMCDIMKSNREYYYLEDVNNKKAKKRLFTDQVQTLEDLCGFELRRTFLPLSRKRLWMELRTNSQPCARPHLRAELRDRYIADTKAFFYPGNGYYVNIQKSERCHQTELIISNIVNIMDNDAPLNVLEKIPYIDIIRELPNFLSEFLRFDPEDILKFYNVFNSPIDLISEHIWFIFYGRKPLSIVHERFCKTGCEKDWGIVDVSSMFPSLKCKVCSFAEFILEEWKEGRWLTDRNMPDDELKKYNSMDEGVSGIEEKGACGLKKLWDEVFRMRIVKNKYNISYFLTMLIADYYFKYYQTNYKKLEREGDKIDPPIKYLEDLRFDLECVMLGFTEKSMDESAFANHFFIASWDFPMTKKLEKCLENIRLDLLERDFLRYLVKDSVMCIRLANFFDKYSPNYFLFSQCVWEMVGYPPITNRCYYHKNKICSAGLFANFVLSCWSVRIHNFSHIENLYKVHIAYCILMPEIPIDKFSLQYYVWAIDHPEYLEQAMSQVKNYPYHRYNMHFLHDQINSNEFYLSCGCYRKIRS